MGSGPSAFANSKVGSAAGFVVVAGNMMAMPHGGRRSASATSLKPAFTGHSEYSNAFKEVPHCFASMDRKPLTPYSMHAYRSRIALEDPPVPLKHASSIQLRDPHAMKKRQFVTTNKNHFAAHAPGFQTNAAVLAAKTKV